SQSPLASPFAAASSESIVCGPEIGAAADVASISPKNDASRTLPSRIGRNHQRSGTFAAVARIVAARSPVRPRHDSSFAQRAAYLRICSSVVVALQAEFPRGLTPTSTDRATRAG